MNSSPNHRQKVQKNYSRCIMGGNTSPLNETTRRSGNRLFSRRRIRIILPTMANTENVTHDDQSKNQRVNVKLQSLNVKLQSLNVKLQSLNVKLQSLNVKLQSLQSLNVKLQSLNVGCVPLVRTCTKLESIQNNNILLPGLDQIIKLVKTPLFTSQVLIKRQNVQESCESF
ncbi:hypothetical protein NL108_017160 [Boleophthalmus pectinirostris]|nr:hypothetical protein NL108_017160 [Boleophthalmus pectinirostris]